MLHCTCTCSLGDPFKNSLQVHDLYILSTTVISNTSMQWTVGEIGEIVHLLIAATTVPSSHRIQHSLFL